MNHHPSYLHLDLRKAVDGVDDQNLQRRLANAINSHMLTSGCYDPRRQAQFPDPEDTDENNNPVRWTLGRRREMMNRLSPFYYELWRVPIDFTIEKLLETLDQLNDWGSYYLQIVHIIDNEHVLIKHPPGLQYRNG
ncbi:hypothetical protein BDR26DRAFT_1012808 [Obelidium mucronatum]|nr:hypothetical protein BDR26DRAFT_1012808 [Obelidium mucronatum]